MTMQKPVRIAVVCEAPADQRTACALADRVLGESVAGLGPAQVDGVRVWCGARLDTTFIA